MKALNNSWFLVVNPEAGSGTGRKDWPYIKSLLDSNNIKYEFALTQRKYHAVELTVAAIGQGYRKLVAVGGDGTLNEVVNGIFLQETVPSVDVTVGVIAVGTGNDWTRMYCLPSTYEGKVKALKDEKVFLQDVGVVEYQESLVKQKRYFANAAGVGFDAEVARRTNRLKEMGRRGKVLYMLNLVKALFAYKATHVKADVDGLEVGGPVFSLTLGIGRFNGGGMMQVPNAVADDGLYDLTLIHHIRRFDVIRNIHRLYNGTILEHPRISSFQGRSIRIASEPPVLLEVDGESLGVSPFTFDILPKSIRVVVGADFSELVSTTTEVLERTAVCECC